MKKNLLILGVLAIAAFLPSCGGGGGLTGNKSKQQAGEIIDYYNQSIDILRKSYPSDDMDKMLEYIEKKGKMHVAPMAMTVRFGKLSEVNNPGSCFSKEVREELVESYTAFFDAGEQFYKNYSEFKDYVKTEDYKDDNWKKGNEILEENRELYDIVNYSRNAIRAILGPLADDAEALLMDDNPLRDHILTAKGLFSAMEEMMEEFYEDKTTPAEVDRIYSDIEAKLEGARKLDFSGDYEREERYYGQFLDKVDSFMGVARKARRDGKYGERQCNDLMNQYNNAVSRYNSFVD